MRALRASVACLLASTVLCAQPAALQEDSRKARDLLAQRRFADAVPYLENLVAAMPANTQLRLNLAVALHMAGQDGKAIPQLETVLKQQPAAFPALMLLGASYMRTRQPAQAVPVLERALRLEPADGEGRAMLADALLMLERYEDAIPHLERIAVANPNDPKSWYGLGRAYEAVAVRAFERLEKSGPDSPYWLMLAADVRLSAGRGTAAFSLYRAVLDKAPAFRGAHAGLAGVYRKNGREDWAAIEERREAQLPPPGCAPPSCECHFTNGRFTEALSLALASMTPESLYWRARSANELARGAFARLAKLPPSLEGHRMLAEVFRRSGRHDGSIREWRAAMELAPNDPQLELELTTSVFLSGDYSVAERNLRALLSRYPKLPELHYMLGVSLLGQQKPGQAIPSLETALKLSPGSLPTRAALGKALLESGKPAQAIPHLEAALAQDEDGSRHFQLSQAYRDTGREDQAAALLKKYQEISRSRSAPAAAITGPDQ